MTHFSAVLHNFCENENQIWDTNKLSFPWAKIKRMFENKKDNNIVS